MTATLNDFTEPGEASEAAEPLDFDEVYARYFEFAYRSLRLLGVTADALEDATRLLASDGVARALAVPLSLNREDERYDFSFRHVDRDGAATGDAIGFVFGHDQPISRKGDTLTVAPGMYGDRSGHFGSLTSDAVFSSAGRAAAA